MTVHGAGLVLPPSAGDALFQARGIPRQIEIDHRVRDLQVEAHPAGFRGEEQAAVRILTETADLVAAALLRHLARVPRELDVLFHGVVAHEIEHSDPFGEHDDLAARLRQEVRE